MKRKYKTRVRRRYDGNRLGVEFGGEVTLVMLARTKLIPSDVSTIAPIILEMVIEEEELIIRRERGWNSYPTQD